VTGAAAAPAPDERGAGTGDDPPGGRRWGFDVRAESAAAPDAVFAVIADATRWHEWAGPMIVRSTWERTGTPAPGGVGAVRRLGVPPFWAHEEIVAFDPPRHQGYVVRGGLPVRDYRADVVLVPIPTGTRLEWSGSLVAKVPGTGRLLAAVLRRTVRGFARRAAAAAVRPPGA